MLMNKILTILIAIFLFAGGYGYTLENSIDHPVIDSALTLEEALKGLSPGCPEDIKNNQTLVDVLYYSPDGRIHKGQIVMDQRLADDVRQVFQAVLDEKFPIASVIPINQFAWNDDDSMAQNNTSGFNYREVTGGKKISNHAYGFAIDINPFFNPYVKEEVTLPPGAVYNPREPGTLSAEHVIVKMFLEMGWEWGGSWESLKDYQHFEKIIGIDAN